MARHALYKGKDGIWHLERRSRGRWEPLCEAGKRAPGARRVFGEGRKLVSFLAGLFGSRFKPASVCYDCMKRLSGCSKKRFSQDEVARCMVSGYLYSNFGAAFYGGDGSEIEALIPLSQDAFKAVIQVRSSMVPPEEYIQAVERFSEEEFQRIQSRADAFNALPVLAVVHLSLEHEEWQLEKLWFYSIRRDGRLVLMERFPEHQAPET